MFPPPQKTYNLFQQIRDLAASQLPETIRFLMDLVRTPSFSTKEREVVEVIRHEMQAVGFDEIRIDGMGNIVGRIGSGARVIAFDAHVDTVYPGELSLWSFDPFSPKIEDGKIWGRGAVDQKGGMAAMIGAAKIIKEMALQNGLTILFVGSVMEEDCDGLCWKYLIQNEKLRPELVIITEPTNMNIYRGQRGRMEIVIQVKGVSCHGSAPERGENALYKAAHIALEIEKLNEVLPADVFLGKGTVAVTQEFFSSPSQCSVPDGARLHLDRRLTLGETKEKALEEIRDVVNRSGCSEAAIEIPQYEETSYTGLRFSAEKYYPVWTLEDTSPFLRASTSTFRKLFEREPFVDKWTFSTNGVAIRGIFGIPCIGFGPGNEVFAHAQNEACPIDHLRDAAAFYAALIASLN